jgi:hypothetical protein
VPGFSEFAMKIDWNVEPEDIRNVNEFVDSYLNNPFVKLRVKRNLNDEKEEISKERCWHTMVSCFLTTQQRSGPDSSVSKLILTEPFLLNFKLCSMQADLHDPYKLTRDVTNIGHYGTGQVDLKLKSLSDLDKVVALIEQSYLQTV